MSEPTEEEVDQALNAADEQVEKGNTKWHGMTYEQGVQAAIMWMRGDWDNPMVDE